jgi:hypothetical protein
MSNTGKDDAVKSSWQSGYIFGFVCLVGKLHLKLWNGVYYELFPSSFLRIKQNNFFAGLGLILSLAVGISISWFHANTLGLPVDTWLPSGVTAMVITLFYIFPIAGRTLLWITNLNK